MTSNKEDYLRALYDLDGIENYVTNKALAEKLGVQPASVSEMLSKLHGEGLLELRAYHGTRLTEKGMQACRDVVRSHELWEVFLQRHLGYSWWEAHEDAHLLEHIGSERMVDRLDEFLGHPKTCPHGGIIPQKGEPLQRPENLVPLSQLEMGERATVSRIVEDKKLFDYLEDTGLVIGRDITVIEKQDFEGPVTFLESGHSITVSYKAAEMIYTERISETSGKGY